MEEVGVFLWLCVDDSCVRRLRLSLLVCFGLWDVSRVSLDHQLLRLNKQTAQRALCHNLDIKYTQSKSRRIQRNRNMFGTRVLGSCFIFMCVPGAVFFFVLLFFFLFRGRQSARTSSFKWKYLQMISKFSTIELLSHPHRWTGAAQEEINVCVRDGFSADHRPVNEPSCTSVTVSPEGNVNVRLEVRTQTLRLQFRHTCIFPSALSSQDEDCLNKRPLVCVCVCVHTPCAISLVLMRAVLNV